jgi:hypothetical protein
VVIWYIFPNFGILFQEISGSPDLQLQAIVRLGVSPTRFGMGARDGVQLSSHLNTEEIFAEYFGVTFYVPTYILFKIFLL